MDVTIRNAIRRKLRVEFNYKGYSRVVEIYRYGQLISGNMAIRAIQVAGSSSTGNNGFQMKLWTLKEIKDLRLTNQTFSPVNVQYSDKAFGSIFAQLD